MFALVGGAAVVALPFIARLLDGSADEFSGSSMPVMPAIGWIVCAVLAAIVLAHRVQIWGRFDAGPVLAVAYDLLPLLLLLAPVVAVIALLTGHLLLACAGAALTVYEAWLVIPRLIAARVPHWAHRAPHFHLVVANVYVDNETPDAAARQLSQSGADVIVIAEATPSFMSVFDAIGGDRSHPHRVWDPHDDSDYALAVVSRLPLGDGSEMRMEGPLRLAIAEVQIGDITTTVAALNPRSTFDADGQDIWKRQIEALKHYVPTVHGPLVVAGDLNSTEFRPEFDELLEEGLIDAIDALGEAWKPSFSLKSVWPLGAVGSIARLDQALVNDQVAGLHMQNLDACGSDHVPFIITLAVREPQAPTAAEV